MMSSTATRWQRVPATAAMSIVVLMAGCAAPGDGDPRFIAGEPSAAPPSAAPSPARPPRVESANGDIDPLGDVIDTGLHNADGKEYVIFGVTGDTVNESSEFGFALGLRESPTVVTEDVTVSEYKGSAMASGFHPMQGQMELEDESIQPAFGYYVGEPATISVVEVGRTLKAQLVRWSHDQSVTVFWFDPAQVRDDSQWTELGAYDAAGNRLPDGNIERHSW